MLVKDIFDFIHGRNGNKPVFLINPCCRNLLYNGEPYNSNYETNIRGLVPKSARRKRIEAKLAATDSGGGAGHN